MNKKELLRKKLKEMHIGKLRNHEILLKQII